MRLRETHSARQGGVVMRGVVKIVEYVIAVGRVFFVLLVALFLPQLFIWHANQTKEHSVYDSSTFKLGLENITDSFVEEIKADKSSNVGLITNQSGIDQAGNRSIDVLLSKGFDIKKIFTPLDEVVVTNPKKLQSLVRDNSTGIQIVSLSLNHGLNTAKKHIKELDVLMFDMQDSGMRYYGYINTLLDAMDCAAKNGKKFVVLDRPNLLGWCMEGSLNCEGGKCAEIPVPLRHGMTVGELANYLNKNVLAQPAKLYVVPMKNYSRQANANAPLLCNLSRNITNADSCYGYSFLGLLGQVAPFDTGGAADKAFQCIMLPETMKFPKYKWHELRTVLKDHNIESTLHRYYNGQKKENYVGLRLYIKDINSFSSFNTLLTVLQFFKDSGVSLAFGNSFDHAIGTQKVRSMFEGTVSHRELAGQVNGDLQLFFKKAVSCFLYKPFPKMVQV